MQIIVDSGATKANWVILENATVRAKIATGGISPLHLLPADTQSLLQAHLSDYQYATRKIYFYATGCGSQEQQQDMQQRLGIFFKNAEWIEVHGDMFGSARALLGDQTGLAAILGTGSNSCLYDGIEIVHNWGGIGYVLGDEGSGASMGKKLLNAYLTYQLPANLRTEFDQIFGLSRGVILEKVYREPLASRYLGTFVPFVSERRECPFFQKFLSEFFQKFLLTNIKIYPDWDQLPIGISGSVGYYFQNEISAAATAQGIDIQQFVKDPLPPLVAYHLQKNI